MHRQRAGRGRARGRARAQARARTHTHTRTHSNMLLRRRFRAPDRAVPAGVRGSGRPVAAAGGGRALGVPPLERRDPEVFGQQAGVDGSTALHQARRGVPHRRHNQPAVGGLPDAAHVARLAARRGLRCGGHHAAELTSVPLGSAASVAGIMLRAWVVRRIREPWPGAAAACPAAAPCLLVPIADGALVGALRAVQSELGQQSTSGVSSLLSALGRHAELRSAARAGWLEGTPAGRETLATASAVLAEVALRARHMQPAELAAAASALAISPRLVAALGASDCEHAAVLRSACAAAAAANELLAFDVAQLATAAARLRWTDSDFLDSLAFAIECRARLGITTSEVGIAGRASRGHAVPTWAVTPPRSSSAPQSTACIASYVWRGAEHHTHASPLACMALGAKNAPASSPRGLQPRRSFRRRCGPLPAWRPPATRSCSTTWPPRTHQRCSTRSACPPTWLLSNQRSAQWCCQRSP